MDLTPYRRTETLTIAAPADAVYDLVADVSRMGDWSPVCTGGEYDADDPSWFTGHNAIGSTTWSTRCHVVAADRGREFAFVNCGGTGERELVRWGFTLRPDGDGTEVTQSWEVLPGYEPGFLAQGHTADELAARLDFMQGLAETGMPETLEHIRVAAEQ